MVAGVSADLMNLCLCFFGSKRINMFLGFVETMPSKLDALADVADDMFSVAVSEAAGLGVMGSIVTAPVRLELAGMLIESVSGRFFRNFFRSISDAFALAFAHIFGVNLRINTPYRFVVHETELLLSMTHLGHSPLSTHRSLYRWTEY